MSGLRERQKEDRRARILEAARGLFAGAGYDKTTIEAIAARTGVSSVTVHNYFGTKSGILLALVAESDRTLVARMQQELASTASDLVQLAMSFARLIRNHAISNLDKALWRQVIAASITDTDSRFVRDYHDLDQRLAACLVAPIGQLQSERGIACAADATDLSRLIFNVQNARFVQYIAVEEMTDAAVEELLRADFKALADAGVRSVGQAQG